ncbi:hypothetical protein [Phenylobacterium sp.]|uniref:hypothetical protein n=1 Tax=Phenylobacterium sp. TaxID=1871053 RepID=UPI001219EABE|nr:hypothetical protein [Phenylobacterium sp.]THD58622.1 MAG: hypothetical protein E8A49_19060 [Phenylobacterium sp.]
MKPLLIGLAAAGAAAALALSALPASADVVCNRDGDCWHAHEHYNYAPNLGVVVHPDDWYFHQHWDDHHHWRDYHEGRGYYRGGVWVPF